MSVRSVLINFFSHPSFCSFPAFAASTQIMILLLVGIKGSGTRFSFLLQLLTSATCFRRREFRLLDRSFIKSGILKFSTKNNNFFFSLRRARQRLLHNWIIRFFEIKNPLSDSSAGIVGWAEDAGTPDKNSPTARHFSTQPL